MVHSIRSLCLLTIIVCCVMSCGCTGHIDNTEISQNTQKGFEQSNITSDFNLDDQSENSNETLTDSVSTNQPEITSTSSTTTDIERNNLFNMPPAAWYKVGFVYNEEFAVPNNWLPIMTGEEAFENFDEITDGYQSKNDIGKIIQKLMNRNVIAFELVYGIPPAYEAADIIDPFDENYSRTSGAHPIRSDYFNCLDDIIELMNGTYTERLAYERLNGAEGERVLFFEEDGQLFVDLDSMAWWSSDPYMCKTFIEILDSSESECSFIWHFVDWEHWDNEGYPSNKPYPYHQQKTCYAVIENNEWRLKSIVFNNMSYTQD